MHVPSRPEVTMRLTGPRRGNPMLRFMIEHTARRRMWSPPSPARDGAIAEASEGAERRWGREFFERLRDGWLPRMAHVEDTPDGELRYLGSHALSLWAFVTPHATALAYDVDDTEAQIRARAALALLPHHAHRARPPEPALG